MSTAIQFALLFYFKQILSLPSGKQVVTNAPFFTIVHGEEHSDSEEESSEPVVGLAPFDSIESFRESVAFQLCNSSCAVGILKLKPMFRCLPVLKLGKLLAWCAKRMHMKEDGEHVAMEESKSSTYVSAIDKPRPLELKVRLEVSE